MSSSRLVRGAKTRMFAFVCLIFVLGAVLYVFHGTQVRLADVQLQAVACTQQKESVHAQLQVIFEYKERLEKALNKEKTDHKQTKELLEKKLRDEKEKMQNEHNSKYDVLQQKNNGLQGQLEELKENAEKVLNEKTKLETALESIKTELKSSKSKNDDAMESLKTEFLKKGEEVISLQEELRNYKKKSLPETDKSNHLEKQNFQLIGQLEQLNTMLAECKSAKESERKAVAPSPSVDEKSNDAGEMEAGIPRLHSVLKNFSSTPGINPEALLGLSSAKPSLKDTELVKKLQDEQQAAVVGAPKKPTQESVVPLIQPGKVDDSLAQGQGQIPLPPDSHNPNSNILPKPNVGEDIVGDMSNNNINLPEDSEDDLIRQQQAKAQIQEPRVFLPDANRAEEEEEQIPQFKPPGKNPENYHGGDYDKEQAEEEDDEGERIDYDGDRSLIDGKGKMKVPPQVKQAPQRNGGGIMVNPK